MIILKDDKKVKEITSMDEDFAKWYTDVVLKAELVGYTAVKGCMVIRPYGYAIWENIPVTNYTITATAGANGTISPSGDITVAAGENKTFTFTHCN